jgi:hypothetical protein
MAMPRDRSDKALGDPLRSIARGRPLGRGRQSGPYDPLSSTSRVLHKESPSGQRPAQDPPRARPSARVGTDGPGRRPPARRESMPAGGRDAARPDRYASATSAGWRWRFQSRRGGWPLRTRAQARRARRQRWGADRPRNQESSGPRPTRPAPETKPGREAALAPERRLRFPGC